jgi:hypothetical protein
MGTGNYKIALRVVAILNLIYAVIGFLVSVALNMLDSAILNDGSVFSNAISAGIPVAFAVLIITNAMMLNVDATIERIRAYAAVSGALALLFVFSAASKFFMLPALAFYFIYCFSFPAKSPLRRSLAKWTMGLSLGYFFATLLFQTPDSLASILNACAVVGFVILAGLLNVIRTNTIVQLTHVSTYAIGLATGFYCLTSDNFTNDNGALYVVAALIVIGTYWYKVRALIKQSQQLLAESAD